MSTRDFVAEHCIRLKVSALAFAVGACVGVGAGMYATFQPEVRSVAATYIAGSAMRGIGLCAFPAFGRIPRPCQVDAAVNRAVASPTDGREVRDLAYTIANGKRRVLKRWMPFTAFGAGLAAWLLLAVRNRRAWRTRPDTTEDHIRGAETASDKRLDRAARRERGDGDLKIGRVTVPRAVEPEHFLITGGTGKGKTVTITQMLDAIRRRGDRVIVADYAGSVLARFGLRPDMEDRVLNPLDDRALPWSPFMEIEAPADADLVARALIPDAEGQDAQWNRHAQTFISALLLRGYAAEWTNRDLLHYALESDMDELRKVLAGTPAAGLLTKGNERMFGSVRGTVTAYAGGLRYCDPGASRGPGSLRRWATTGKGWAFFNYRQDQLAVIGPLAGAMLDLITTGILSQVPDRDRRTWLVLDEVAALGKVNGLEDFLTKGRQFGGCVIMGLQSIAQLRKRYGPDSAETMLGNLSTEVIYSGSDPDTVQYLSRAIGQEEVLRRTPGANNGDHGASAAWSEAVQVVASVMASEISRLPALHCFLKLSGGLPVAEVRVPLPPQVPDKAERFVPRDFSRLWAKPDAPAAGDAAPGAVPDLPDFGPDDGAEAP